MHVFIKPLDKEMLNRLVEESVTIVTVEDNVIRGGLGILYIRICK